MNFLTTAPLVDTVIKVAATRRATRLIMDDKISEPLRNKIYNSDSAFLQYLISCPWCVSIWAAGTLSVLENVPHPAARTLAKIATHTLALSEASTVSTQYIP